MGDLVPFAYEGRQVRTVTINGETWFVASDVCVVLEIANPRSSLALLDEDEKGVHSVDTPGGEQQVTIISEAGLYSLILRSRKPEAKAFKRWVTHVVIPEARRRLAGGLPALPDMTTAEGALVVVDLLRKQIEQRVAAEELAAEQARELASARPKAAFVDAFVDPAEDVTTIGDFAQQLGLSEQALRDYLVQHKVIWRRVLGRRWSRSQAREVIEYQWRACKGYEGWFTSKDHPEVQKRLYNGQIPKTLYVNPVGKVRIKEMLAATPIEEPSNVTKLPARRRGKRNGPGSDGATSPGA